MIAQSLPKNDRDNFIKKIDNADLTKEYSSISAQDSQKNVSEYKEHISFFKIYNQIKDKETELERINKGMSK